MQRFEAIRPKHVEDSAQFFSEDMIEHVFFRHFRDDSDRTIQVTDCWFDDDLEE